MDSEVTEMLVYVRENIADLKNLGKDWGLTDEEIQACVDKAMLLDPKDLPASNKTLPKKQTTQLKFAARKAWPKMRIFLLTFSGLLLLMGTVVMVLGTETLENQFHRLDPFGYSFLRSVRLMADPLHNFFNTYDHHYKEECGVHNPWYDEESVMEDEVCQSCEFRENLIELEAGTFEVEDVFQGSNFSEPLLVKNAGQKVNLETFQSVLSRNSFAKKPMFGITTNLPWASQVADLLKDDVAEKLAAQPDFYFFWQSKMAWTSQIMRKLFARPLELGSTFQTNIRKDIFITGSKCKAISLKRFVLSPFTWYVQGWGSGQVTITPPEVCAPDCTPITVMLTAGDMLIFDRRVYSASVQPAGEDYSICFVGHFEYLY